MRSTAFVFERENGSWEPTRTLAASDGNVKDDFGRALALSGDIALVGAPLDWGPSGNEAGAAYLFDA